MRAIGRGKGVRFSQKSVWAPLLRAGAMACDMDMLGSLFDPKTSRLFKVRPGLSG